MTFVTINSKTYHIGASTFQSGYSALFECFKANGKQHQNEYNIVREWDYIAENPDRKAAYLHLNHN